MSVMSKVLKLGIAKKVLDEARKPENQEKIKQMVSSATKRGKRTQA